MSVDRSFFRRFSDHVPTGAIRAKRRHSLQGHQPFRPLPAPTGPYPYHLKLDAVVAGAGADGKLVFHCVGDTGGIKTPVPQMNVAHAMERDIEASAGAGRPAFFYHLGDVVYFYGEAQEYYPQFYDAYAGYEAPIFAIPGNHDGDLSLQMQQDNTPSLAAFVRNFCASIPHHSADAVDARRSAMNQPNVYWTLETPLATIVGLYTNVPDGGHLDDDQIAWLKAELMSAPKGLPLLLAMHHPIYSIDDHHSGSVYMHDLLQEVIADAKRAPDMVLAGHVHNYQRFTRTWADKTQTPFVVAGAGGYHNLHHMSTDFRAAKPGLPYQVPGEEGVALEAFCDDKFGFLRLELTPAAITGTYFAVPGFTDPMTSQATAIDSFTLDVKQRAVTGQPVKELAHASPEPGARGRGARHPS